MKVFGNKGFSFVELMVTVAIISLMGAGAFAALASGRASWFTAEAGIQVQESLRKALDQVSTELRESRFSQTTVTTGGGFGGTDIVKFSVPVICHAGDSLIDSSANVAHWGATTKFNCRDSACMDADNNCSTVEYKYIQYELIAGNLFVRKILDNSNIVVKQDTVAINVADFKVNMPGASSPVTVTIKSQVSSVLKRPISATVSTNILFRNV